MACKIAETSATVEAVVWRSASSGGSPTRTLETATRGSRPENRPGQQDGEEWERAKQLELTQARQAAFEQGLRKGRDEAAGQVKEASDQLARILADLAGLKRRARNEAECDMVKLSLAIARRILHRELSLDSESIQGVVHAALQKLGNREVTTVRVWPAGADAVRAALERADAVPSISIVADGKLRAGDIVFETNLGELDASVDTQLKEIERGFADRLNL